MKTPSVGRIILESITFLAIVGCAVMLVAMLKHAGDMKRLHHPEPPKRSITYFRDQRVSTCFASIWILGTSEHALTYVPCELVPDDLMRE